MEIGLVIIAAGIAIGVLRLLLGRQGRALAEDWMTAARAAGLQDVSTTNVSGSRRLDAGHGTLRIRVLPAGAGSRVSLDGLAAIGIALRGRSAVPRRVLEIGDADFDRALVVEGAPFLARALLDTETRVALVDLAAARGAFAETELVSLTNGLLVARCHHGEPPARVTRLAESLRALATLGERLTPPALPEERLAGILAKEPFPVVRLRALQLLVADRPDHAATLGAVRAALADPDDRVRMTAALAAGEAGDAVLRAMEPSLLPALGHEDATVREAAARALGRVGSVAAVPALRAAEAVIGGAAREAIASVQSRIIGADHGQLALAQAAGEVSLADDARGRVSPDES